MYLLIDEIEGPPVHIVGPEIVGQYSISGEKCYQSDLSQLKYYKPPRDLNNVRFDLDKDRELAVSKPNDGNNKLDYILRWMSENFDSLKIQDSDGPAKRWLQPEIVCYRGTLTTLLVTPYDRQDGWIICASKFENTIYLCAFDTEIRKQKRSSETDYEKRCTAWGHKFEQYMVADKPSEKPDTSTPLNELEEFCSLFKSQLGNTSLLYGAEMDGIHSQQPITDTLVGKKVEFVELKTINGKLFNHYGQVHKSRSNKVLRWWGQSYLVGIRKIICGCKNKNGLVTKIREVNLEEVTKRSKSQYNWDVERCRSFCNGFLEHVKTLVCKDYNECLYKFTLNPGKSNVIQVDEMRPDPESEYMFLYQWYIDKAKEHKKNF